MSVVIQPGAKKAIKFLGLIAICGLAWVGINKYKGRTRDAKQSMDIGAIALPDAPEASLTSNAQKLSFPSSDIAANGGTKITDLRMAWNSQLGVLYANGGIQTTKGSLMDKYKLQVTITRQDDGNKAMAELVKLANACKTSGTNIPGVFVSLMGDGMPAFATATQKELSKLGPEYGLTLFYANGKSYGEDKVMAPVEWKRDPKNALGKTVSCVLRDGDMNILLKWAGDNNLKVNPDETTYDSSAINLIAANDFLDAANKYITGYKENRKIVTNGKTNGQTIEVGVDAVATWTPGDVNIAQNKGGLVSIASTKQYSTQMPCVVITIKKWAEAHREDVDNYITAVAQAGDQVRSFTDAKAYAAQVSAKVWGEKDGEYWLKYYNGTTQKDKQGLNVELGGSMAFNLADAANTFGLGKDGLDRYKAVYTTFGDKLSKMYPEIMPTYTPYESLVDKSYLQDVIQKHPELLDGKALTTTYSTEISSEVSNKSYNIQFEIGSDQIKPTSYAALDEIFKSAVVAESLTLGVYGHTDNTGNPEANQTLSERRAASVKQYLAKKGLSSARIISKGYGSSAPLEGVDENSATGRAQNRRVEIVLGE